MGFIRVPLLIVGMFASFALILLAMLFFSGAVESREQLLSMFRGGPDSTRVFDEFRLVEDRMGEMYDLAREYKERQEERAAQTLLLQDSLAGQRTRLQALEDSLLGVQQQLGLIGDSTRQAARDASLTELARFYESIKAQAAAEILQQEAELSDTTVAALMKRLPPRQMAKIMASMNADYAARITKLMKEQTP